MYINENIWLNSRSDIENCLSHGTALLEMIIHWLT